jgi:hypothetical protein
MPAISCVNSPQPSDSTPSTTGKASHGASSVNVRPASVIRPTTYAARRENRQPSRRRRDLDSVAVDTSRGVVVQRLLAIAAVVTAALSVVSVGAGARQQSGAI